MTRRRWLILGVVAVLALLAGVAVAWHLAKQPAADIHNGESAFFSDPPTTTRARPRHRPRPTKKKPFEGEPPWPMYGYNVARTRDASAYRQIKPPFRTVWKRKTFGILEYPPSFADGTLYLATDSGWTQAMDARTGDPVWTRRLGAGLANEAALSKTMMYVGSHDGHVYALSRKNGKIIWKTKVGSEVECSQLYYRGRVYSGSHSGQVRAMDAKTGHILWTFQAGGEVKSGLSTADGAAVLRRLLEHDVRAADLDRQAALAHAHGRPLQRLPQRLVLLDAVGRLRTRLHRQHRRQALLVRGVEPGRSPGRTRSAAGSTAARPCTTGWCSRPATPVSSRR